MTIRNFITFIETVDWSEIYWDSLNREKAKEFVMKNSMPDNEVYGNANGLIHDIECANGLIALPRFADDKFVKYFEELINYSIP